MPIGLGIGHWFSSFTDALGQAAVDLHVEAGFGSCSPMGELARCLGGKSDMNLAMEEINRAHRAAEKASWQEWTVSAGTQQEHVQAHYSEPAREAARALLRAEGDINDVVKANQSKK
mmetsp:Transcript_75107/g.163889  ORF Transcript_75107/g.163889 Transcript_75107/m.163889 type:complete len:117 (+) Transcript_75107:163-513(+)|eukprot:CAMPEP_0206544894 /NCGR_PEP_ID=MMETSP0325_2-20121206/11814_1 /ASSEMBLY_ACC=CAM_ASM_000347 /TAXON_ID=2866 /ORGANISM="Crypthecodinium cohnii, Strain Seligo" /LENGTH=116 /DNA_ID=CAMNT_0054043779 /DNA_START=80 /DNA_END=430 /DNA_ORIENTATION=-